MNELSLFTGAGGGVLGTKLLGFKHVGYVEYDNYCQKILKQRIEDGILDPAPIFGDIRNFIGEGFAEAYKGLVDLVSAGFPCQPFSCAGNQNGEADERNMWPETADVIRIVRPRFVLLENVPGIRDYLPVVIRDLRRLGFKVRRPLKLGADNVGGEHIRKRVWILAYSEQNGWEPQIAPPGRTLPYSEGKPREARRKIGVISCNGYGGRVWGFPDTDVHRSFDDVAHWVDRLNATGNGQVPEVVRTAWEILSF